MMQGVTYRGREVGVRLAARTSKSSFLVNLLNPESHNIQHFRVGSEMCPGKRGAHCRAGDLAAYGHLSMLQTRLARLELEGGREAILKELDVSDADLAAENGHVDVIRGLRAHGIHCTFIGADRAAKNDEMDVVRDLREHGVDCTSQGANWAAASGHATMIADLRAHGIHPTFIGADRAAENGHLDVIRDLRAHGIHCSALGIDLAASKGHLDVVQDLRAHGFHPTPWGEAWEGHHRRAAIQRLRGQHNS